MKLYEINEALEQALEAAFDPETGEILDEDALAQVETLELAREDKLEGIACWIKDLRADAEAIKTEKNNLAKRERAANNKADRLTEYLKWQLAGEKLKTARASVSYRRSEAVELADNFEPMNLPSDCWAVEYKVNKTAIKEHLKAGETLEGAELVTRTSIIIK